MGLAATFCLTLGLVLLLDLVITETNLNSLLNAVTSEDDDFERKSIMDDLSDRVAEAVQNFQAIYY